MYNWVLTRKIARTDGPNYPVRAAQTVDAVVARWAPVFVGLLACAVTPARAKLDSRYYESPNYPVRAVQTVDATIRTYIPATQAELQSYRVAARPPLDVRRYDWDVPDTAWIRATLPVPPTVAQTVPTFTDTGGLTPGRGRLELRRFDWAADETSWIAATLSAAPSVAQTAPAWTSATQSFRTAGGRSLDLFRAQSIPDIFGVPDDWITWVPIQDDGGRTRDAARLDVRRYEWGQPAWITATLPNPATAAQIWPAILEGSGLSYRSLAQPGLDVRRYEWAPESGWLAAVVDAAVATWRPIVDAEISPRTADRPRLDVRRFEWTPSQAWIFTNLPAPATVAQQWPAVLQGAGVSYRSAERARLDVRRYDWTPAFTWPQRVVDAIVATWIPIFDAELSYRTADGARVELRHQDWTRVPFDYLAPAPTPPAVVLGFRHGPIVSGSSLRRG